MQPNSITLVYDENDDGTPEDVILRRFEETTNTSLYTGESHEIGKPFTLKLYRTAPKPTKEFKGVRKCSFKHTKHVVVPGVDESKMIASAAILEASFSIPVGMTESEIRSFTRLAPAVFADALLMALVKDQEI